MSNEIPVWKNSVTLAAEIADWDREEADRLLAFIYMSRLAGGLLWFDDGEAIEQISECIVLTDYANSVWAKLAIDNDTDRSNVKFAFFRSFYHTDLFVDIKDSNFVRIREIFDSALKTKAARSPVRFGRVLYDRYNNNFHVERVDHLSQADTERLLLDTEQGVYQYGHDLIGPLGIIKSQEIRRFYANTTIPLWHCDNIGCQHLHGVSLSDRQGHIAELVNKIESYCKKVSGSPSQWSVAISNVNDEFVDPDYGDLFIIIQEQFSKPERSAILSDLLDKDDSNAKLWEIIKARIKRSRYSKPRSEFINGLSAEEVSQLILSCDNYNIIQAIDSLIRSDVIVVPATEIRVSKTTITSIESRCDVSSLGMRSFSQNPIARMAELIWDAYAEAGILGELSWRALKSAGAATPGTVLQYLNSKSPREAVLELILSSSDVTQYVLGMICLELYDNEPNEVIADRILWKFGFSVPRYGREYPTLVRNLDSFRSVLLGQQAPFDEAAREQIRSSGVNLFVNLEHFLESLIGYNIWLLNNDHFEDRFVFESRKFIEAVGQVIGQVNEFSWNEAGGNTLGVLLVYLAESVKWMESLKRLDSEGYQREEGEYPHYAYPGDTLFPFHFKSFWANCDRTELSKYVDAYVDVVNIFLRSDLASVRNGLDHYRVPPRFPTLDTMTACESRLRQAVSSAEIKGLYPKIWWMKTRLIDVTGRYEETLVDQLGCEIKLSYPAILKAIKEVGFGEPALIPYGNLLGQANSSIIFEIKEESHSSTMWKDYPIRRGDIPKFDPLEDGGGVEKAGK